MTEKAAVIHHCEGSGHAMRMFAVAERLEDRGLEVEITGGGPGEKFLEMRGRSEFSPTTTDLRGNFMENPLKAFLHVFSSPLERVSDLREWVRDREPDFIVTDDPIGPVVAFLEGKDFYIVSHASKEVPESRIEGWITWLVNKAIMTRCKAFFYPAVWEGLEPKGAENVGPLAPRGGEEDLDFDILVVPTALKDRTDEFLDELEEYDVRVVGSEDWEMQPSLQPFIEEADYVICGGYSTIMEASVAGTPCIVLPFTSEQKGVADILDDYRGFRTYSGDVRQDLEAIERPEPRENGAEQIAEAITEGRKNRGREGHAAE